MNNVPLLALFSSLLFGLTWGQSESVVSLLFLHGTGEFTDAIVRGFDESCAAAANAATNGNQTKWNVVCHTRLFRGPCDTRHDVLLEAVKDFKPHGIALNTKCEDEPFINLVKNLTHSGMPIVAYGKELPSETGRLAFVGSDDTFLGRTMARLLRTLRPEGGTYAIVGGATLVGRIEGFQDEITRYNHLPGRAHWTEVPSRGNPQEPRNTNNSLFHEELHNKSRLDPTAIVTMMQTPMRHENWTTLVDEHKHRNITWIGVDAADYQIDYLHRKYVDGLIGQQPYDIGATCFDVLYQHIERQRQEQQQQEVAWDNPYQSVEIPPRDMPVDIPSDGKIETHLVSYNIIPVELPPLDVDENLLGPLAWLGWIGFGLVATAVAYCTVWTLRHRHTDPIVRAAQPIFLLMIAAGVLLLASSLIPLSFDDGGAATSPNSNVIANTTLVGREDSSTYRVGICMTVPWLAFTGFTMIFSALFAKTWRINRIVQQKRRIAERVPVVALRDVLAPFALLLTCNWAILLAWTLRDPLQYIRMELEGTDYWNRVLATYGACRSDHAGLFLVPLGLLNFAGVAMCSWQAFQARHLNLAFSEATYIGLTVASLLQAFLTGIPVVLVVRDMPRAYYVVLSLTVFLLSLAVLGLIFVPKMLMQQQYKGKSPAEQADLIRQAFVRQVENYGSGGYGFPSPSPGSDDSVSSNFAYRSDHRRGNDLTITSIPEDRVLDELDDEEESESEEGSREQDEDTDKSISVDTLSPSALSESHTQSTSAEKQESSTVPPNFASEESVD